MLVDSLAFGSLRVGRGGGVAGGVKLGSIGHAYHEDERLRGGRDTRQEGGRRSNFRACHQ